MTKNKSNYSDCHLNADKLIFMVQNRDHNAGNHCLLVAHVPKQNPMKSTISRDVKVSPNSTRIYEGLDMSHQHDDVKTNSTTFWLKELQWYQKVLWAKEVEIHTDYHN